MRAREQAPPQPTLSLGLRAALALGWTGKSPGMDLSHLSQPQKQGTCLGFPGEVTGTVCLWKATCWRFTLKASETSCGFVGPELPGSRGEGLDAVSASAW